MEGIWRLLVCRLLLASLPDSAQSCASNNSLFPVHSGFSSPWANESQASCFISTSHLQGEHGRSGRILLPSFHSAGQTTKVQKGTIRAPGARKATNPWIFLSRYYLWSQFSPRTPILEPGSNPRSIIIGTLFYRTPFLLVDEFYFIPQHLS